MLLEVSGLHAAYGATRVLHGIDFALERGSITALLGANGAGKTTTLRAICAMVEVRGEIRFGGERIDRRSTEDIARLGIAHVPDGRGTFLNLTTEENLRLGAYTRRDRAAVEADLERVFGYFPQLRERRAQQAGTLSGGEQQMLAVSRALMLAPKLMLLDEPSFGLAPLLVRELFGILRAINERERVGMLLVEQHQLGREHQRARYGKHLLLAARQRACLLPAALPQLREIAEDPLQVGFDCGTVLARVCAQAQVLLGGEVEEGAATVGNVRDAQACDVLGAAAVDALTAKTDLALGLHHAAQGAQGRRLACAVRPKQGRDRLFLHCEADPVDHPRGAVGGVEPGYLEQHQPPR